MTLNLDLASVFMSRHDSAVQVDRPDNYGRDILYPDEIDMPTVTRHWDHAGQRWIENVTGKMVMRRRGDVIAEGTPDRWYRD